MPPFECDRFAQKHDSEMLYAVCLRLAFALVMQAWVQVWMEAGIAITTCNSFHLYGADRNCHEAFVRLSTCEVGLNILISGTPWF
jgi:hypothetical protein